MQYVKIKDAIVEQIESGMLSPRQKLPAERKLAESFETTRVTLREALSLLEAEGRIFREDRRGWFISPIPLRYDPSLMMNFADLARSQQRTPSSSLVSAQSRLANRQASRLLKLPPFSDVYELERIRYLEDRPVAFITSYIQPSLFPDLLSKDLTTSLTEHYQASYGVAYAQVRYRLSISSLLGDVAHALRATSGTPAMVLERTHYNAQGEVIDCHIEYWRHDAISIESTADF